MRKIMTILSILVVFILTGILAFNIVHPAQALSPNDPDYIAIQKTLRTYADIKLDAYFSFDDSRLIEVLANDPRGGLVDEHLLKAVQWMKNDPDLKLEDIGFLDANRSIYYFERTFNQIYEDAVSQGKIATPTPVPLTPVPTPIEIRKSGPSPDDPRSLPEIQELIEATGGFIGVRTARSIPEGKSPIGFTLLSVSVNGDLAKAKVDWEWGLADVVLVKKEGHWYIIGENITQWHGG
ncbi:MAG TPA: hypothetical protein PJ988_05700 [Anaerolinea sp.]|nr:hypothetical protein [Anaerolinea sp.]